MLIHNRLSQHVSSIIMPIVRRTDCKPRLVLDCRLTTDAVLHSLFSWRWA